MILVYDFAATTADPDSLVDTGVTSIFLGQEYRVIAWRFTFSRRCYILVVTYTDTPNRLDWDTCSNRCSPGHGTLSLKALSAIGTLISSFAWPWCLCTLVQDPCTVVLFGVSSLCAGPDLGVGRWVCWIPDSPPPLPAPQMYLRLSVFFGFFVPAFFPAED